MKLNIEPESSYVSGSLNKLLHINLLSTNKKQIAEV